MAKKRSQNWRPDRLVTTAELHGGVKDQRHVTPADTVLDRDEIAKLGLEDGDILKLLAQGSIRADGEEGVAAEEGAAAVSEPFNGVSADDFRAFAVRHGITNKADASLDEILAAEPAKDDGKVTVDDVRGKLDALGVEVAADASIDDMLTAAVEHGQPGDVEAEARKIEREMVADDIRKELETKQVPFETDANKPALSRLLAQVRASEPAA